MSFQDDICPSCGNEVHTPCAIKDCDEPGTIKVHSRFRPGVILTILFCFEDALKLQKLKEKS